MQSRFLLSLSWVLASGIYLASCTSGGGSSGSNGGSSGQPVIDASGKKIYTVDPAAGGILSASGITSSDPSFANASVVIPPGALSIPVDISMFQAQSLVSSSTASAVGSSSLMAAGPAVAILPSQSVSITNPLAISIPFSALTSLTGEKQLVVIGIYPGEPKNELETFVGNELDLGTSGVVKLSITRFGAFQVVYSDTVIEKIKVETEIKIEQEPASPPTEQEPTSPPTEQEPTSTVNPYADQVGSWRQHCVPDEGGSRSETIKISVDHSGNGVLEASASQFDDGSCQVLLFNEQRVEKLKFSTAASQGSKINSIKITVETVKFMVPSGNYGHQVCGMRIGGIQSGGDQHGSPDVWHELQKTACPATEGKDNPFKDGHAFSKIEDNRLYVKVCDVESGCVASATPSDWENSYIWERVETTSEVIP